MLLLAIPAYGVVNRLARVLQPDMGEPAVEPTIAGGAMKIGLRPALSRLALWDTAAQLLAHASNSP